MDAVHTFEPLRGQVSWEATTPARDSLGRLRNLPAINDPLALFILLLSFILHSLTGMHKEPTSKTCLRFSLVVASLTVIHVISRYTVPISVRNSLAGQGVNFWSLMFVQFFLLFLLVLLFGYFTLKILRYYLRTTFPQTVVNLDQLMRSGFKARSSGLELSRGILYGLVFTGVWSLLSVTLGYTGVAVTGTLVFLTEIDFGVIWDFTDLAQSVAVPLVGFVSSTFIPIAWVGLPLVFVRRILPKQGFQILTLAVLWTIFKTTLAGTLMYPEWFSYVSSFIQGLFFGWLFLRFGLLACISAVVTIEALLFTFPFFYFLQNYAFLKFGLDLGIWLLLVLFSFSVYFLPQLVEAKRRLAAVFE